MCPMPVNPTGPSNIALNLASRFKTTHAPYFVLRQFISIWHIPTALDSATSRATL
jgi:hypothetical protein